MLLSLLPLSSPCGEDTATGGATQCYKAKLKGMCAEKNSWVRSRCSATCCGIAVDANAVAEAKANLCADDIKLNCTAHANMGHCIDPQFAWLPKRCPRTCRAEAQHCIERSSGGSHDKALLPTAKEKAAPAVATPSAAVASASSHAHAQSADSKQSAVGSSCSDAAPCECTFAQLVVSVDGYHDEATKSLLTDCCSTCCHTIAAAETQFAALAEQIRSFQAEHGLPACR